MSVLLQIDDLAVHYPTRDGLVHAVDGVSLNIESGQTIGLVGESGCGKSTLGKAIMGLVAPTAGRLLLEGTELGHLSRAARRPFARRIQMVFQDPFSSLNPRKSIGRIVEEPLAIHDAGTRATRTRRVDDLLRQVGISPSLRDRLPHEFSGGQRQRIGIARALALNPRLLICDEPVSALDLSIQAQVLNLLVDLQTELNLTYLFISHDLTVVRHISDLVAVMYLGRIVEFAATDVLFDNPQHPYTRALIDAAPADAVTGARRHSRLILEGEVPSPIKIPPGCRFHTRCPMAEPRCRVEVPALALRRDGRMSACHLAGDPAIQVQEDRSDLRQDLDRSQL
ncbi:MAG: ABC transporter ATP-binding protein [Alphaproteobacteria bacterium]